MCFAIAIAASLPDTIISPFISSIKGTFSPTFNLYDEPFTFAISWSISIMSFSFTFPSLIDSIAIKKVIILLKLANGIFLSGFFSYNVLFVSWSISIDPFEYLSILSYAKDILVVKIFKIIDSNNTFETNFFKSFTFQINNKYFR